MKKFDYNAFQAEQMPFFERCAKVREKHVDIFRAADQDMLQEAYDRQIRAEADMRFWDLSGRMGPPPHTSKPDLGPAGELLEAYAADIKAAIGSGRIYTSLPASGPAPERLSSGTPVPTARMDRAVIGVFAASGKDVLDYILRAASENGGMTAGPEGTCFGKNPVKSFDENGDAFLAAPAHVAVLDPAGFRPEVTLVRDRRGNIIPGPFGHEWTKDGRAEPIEVLEMDRMPREYFAMVPVSTNGVDLSAASAAAAGTSVSLEDARAFLEDACAGMKKGYPLDYAVLDPGSAGSRVSVFQAGRYGVHVGTKELENSAVYGYARNSELAWAAKSAFHERRHLYQKEHIFREPMSGRDLDMAVMEACAIAYKGYDDGTYHYRLSETDADREGTKDAIAALSEAFPDTDWEAAMLEAYNGRDQSFDDARAAACRDRKLFRPEATPRTRAWQDGVRYNSMDGIYARFDELDRTYLTAAHEEPCRQFREHDDEILEKNAWDGRFFELLDGDGSKAGPARDREILASILQARVFDVQDYFPGMAGALEDIKIRHGVEGDAARKLRLQAAELDGYQASDGPDGPEI